MHEQVIAHRRQFCSAGESARVSWVWPIRCELARRNLAAIAEWSALIAWAACRKNRRITCSTRVMSHTIP